MELELTCISIGWATDFGRGETSATTCRHSSGIVLMSEKKLHVGGWMGRNGRVRGLYLNGTLILEQQVRTGIIVKIQETSDIHIAFAQELQLATAYSCDNNGDRIGGFYEEACNSVDGDVVRRRQWMAFVTIIECGGEDGREWNSTWACRSI
jgi:hypothetical protein